MCVHVCVQSWPHLWMSLKPDQPETFREKGEVSQEELFISTISPNNTALYWLCCFMCPDIQTSMCVCVYFRRVAQALCCVQCCCLRFFFSPLAVLVWISMHGVAAGQMHRTVKNQQGELPFPKCQAYNSQNDGVAKKKKDGKKREKREKSFAKEERMVKNVSYIIG